MSLSLMTMMGFQRPTRHEKYVIGECIKIIRYSKYPIDDIEADFEKKHNKSLDSIIQDLKKVLARPIREDRVMIDFETQRRLDAMHCRCAMPTCKEFAKEILKKGDK